MKQGEFSVDYHSISQLANRSISQIN